MLTPPPVVARDRRAQVFVSDPRACVKPYKETILAMGLEAKLYIATIYLVSTVFMLPLPVSPRRAARCLPARSVERYCGAHRSVLWQRCHILSFFACATASGCTHSGSVAHSSPCSLFAHSWGFHMAVGYVYGIWESVLLITTTQASCWHPDAEATNANGALLHRASPLKSRQ